VSALDANGDASLDQLREKPFKYCRLIIGEPLGGLAHHGIARGSRGCSTPQSAGGQSHLYPAPVGTGTALREADRLQLTDQPNCPGVGQPEHISQPADMRLTEELLQRQQRNCRTADQSACCAPTSNGT
jgi:hypothetical protein